MRVSVTNERGAALVLVLVIAIAVAALAMASIVLASTGTLTSKFHYKETALQGAGDGGLELGRDSVNRMGASLPDSGYLTLEAGATIYDATGTPIPGVTRYVYAGRTGGRSGGSASAGQYGSNYGSLLSVIRDTRGAVAARRMLVAEESWARFAYAMNRWSNAGIAFGCGESAAGPVHSNQNIYISCGGTPKVLFMGPVSTVGTVSGATGATFLQGYSTGVQPIKWPTPTDLAKLRTYAQEAGAPYDLVGGATITTNPTLRIEFLTIDVNGSGTIEPTEGYFRVFQAATTADTMLAYVTGKRWPRTFGGGVATAADPNLISRNCGAITTIAGTTRFYTASEVYAGTAGLPAAKLAAVRTLLAAASPTRRCFLGGDPRLFQAVTADTLTPNAATTAPFGQWQVRPGTVPVPAQLAAVRPGDQQYFFPMQSYANFKGVIYVTGSVAVSGRLRGRLTVATTGTVALADDILYTVPPGTECSENGDALGITSPEAILIHDNNVNSPFRVNNISTGRFDDTPDNEIFHAFLFTLKQYYGDNLSYNPGAAVGEACATTSAARSGCVRISGGIIQDDVGAATFSWNVSGWAELHTYDKCGVTAPPPYFPTTGRFLRNRYYELDPVWLNKVGVDGYFRTLQAK